MIFNLRNAVILAFALAGLLPMSGARAQWYSSVSRQPPPLYPYAVQSDRPYAVEVSPGIYVIQRPALPHSQPHVRARRADKPDSGQRTPASDRPRVKVDRALVEQLRNGSKSKRANVNTTKIIRDPPVVIETKRYVDDPPRVIERFHVADDEPAGQPGERATREERNAGNAAGKRKGAHKSVGGEKRVIQADAEITILGSDRMSIRLFRKGRGGKANARTE